jgi:hypothetical protein
MMRPRGKMYRGGKYFRIILTKDFFWSSRDAFQRSKMDPNGVDVCDAGAGL